MLKAVDSCCSEGAESGCDGCGFSAGDSDAEDPSDGGDSSEGDYSGGSGGAIDVWGRLSVVDGSRGSASGGDHGSWSSEGDSDRGEGDLAEEMKGR
jgi:hypothetical protein